jgi:hypothetical protein
MARKETRKHGNGVCPPIGALLRYRDRIVRVVAEAGGQRAIIESLDQRGQPFRSAVRWANLKEIGEQLF